MMALAMRALPYLVAVGVVLGGLFAAYSHGVTTERTAWQKRTSDALAAAMASVAEEQEKARKAEQASAVAMSTIDNAYQQGRTDAQTDYERTTAERDAGSIRLRDRFTCPSTASDLPAAGTTTGKRDAAGARGLQRADENFLIRQAKRADDYARQLIAAQQVIRSMEATCSARIVPVDAP